MHANRQDKKKRLQFCFHLPIPSYLKKEKNKSEICDICHDKRGNI